MNRKLSGFLAAVCALALMTLGTASVFAQDEVKEKPPMYSYVAFWNIPRAQWPNVDKDNGPNQKLLEKMLADGTIVGYGNDVNEVHQPDGMTHDNWWSGMSMASVLNVLDKVATSGAPASPVVASSTKHGDAIFVSHYYNWRPGSYKGAYTRVSYYKLKADVPAEAIESLSKHLIAPLLEKLVADGSLIEYEIDTQAIHTEAPGAFWIDVIATNAGGLDKLNMALHDAAKANPLGGSALDSMVDMSTHRDELASSTVTYK